MTLMRAVLQVLSWMLVCCLCMSCTLPVPRPTDPRTPLEQLLMSQAIERSIKDRDVPIPEGTSITLEASGLTQGWRFWPLLSRGSLLEARPPGGIYAPLRQCLRGSIRSSGPIDWTVRGIRFPQELHRLLLYQVAGNRHGQATRGPVGRRHVRAESPHYSAPRRFRSNATALRYSNTPTTTRGIPIKVPNPILHAPNPCQRNSKTQQRPIRAQLTARLS